MKRVLQTSNLLAKAQKGFIIATGPRKAETHSYIHPYTDMIVRFSAPSNVPLDELRKVELGYGIRATISERPD